MVVRRFFVMPDGSVKKQEELTTEEYERFQEKVRSLLTPLAYEYVMQLHHKEYAVASELIVPKEDV
ncbi:MAG: hypothetical protein M1119_11585 [Firmicutes bacterium]|nr:hypothetical protein [Bacillota bacterium]